MPTVVMEPCSILELTSCVLKVVSQIYKFLKTVQNTPRDVRDYLVALENTRKVLAHVEDYILFHERTLFRAVDKTQLETISAVLQECKLTFTLQLSAVQKYDTQDTTSTWRQLRKKIGFGFGQESLNKCTTKLQAFQSLLNKALTASIGKDTVVIRAEVGVVKSEIIEMAKKQQQQHQQMLFTLEQYTTTTQKCVPKPIDHTLTADILNSTKQMDSEQAMETRDQILGHNEVSVPLKTLEQFRHSSSMEVSSTSCMATSGSSVPLDHTNCHLGRNTVIMYSRNDSFWRLPEEKCQFLGSETKALSANNHQDLVRILGGIACNLFITRKMRSSLKQNSSLVDDMLMVPGQWCIIYVHQNATKPFELIGPTSPQRKPPDETCLAIEQLFSLVYSCDRELKMYQDQRMTDLVGQIIKPVECSYEVLTFNPKYQVSKADRRILKRNITELRHISEQIRLEVDYRHRVETRETALRAQDIQVQQQLMTRMLQDQKSVLDAMMRKSQQIESIQGQQEVLQNMLQLRKVVEEGQLGIL
ncbi:hypothetical protein GGR57DRAFT_517404 [Xylariaceae sp. FL1272]|nr:hypothetical protein GGR57DRAFT_517404 [Xylariaceae sp. FL1272]